MEHQSIIKETNSKMKKAVERTLHEFNTLHTGKASPGMVEGILIDPYGTGAGMRLKEMAAITTPDARTIEIQPWDKNKVVLEAIVKSIQTADVGLNPVLNGLIIRCPIPELSGDRRKALAKKAHAMAEEGRVGVRAARRDAMEALKKAQKNGTISEDDLKRFEKEVQIQTDKNIEEITSHLTKKETELTKV